jgi:hypothetical protein
MKNVLSAQFLVQGEHLSEVTQEYLTRNGKLNVLLSLLILSVQKLFCQKEWEKQKV